MKSIRDLIFIILLLLSTPKNCFSANAIIPGSGVVTSPYYRENSSYQILAKPKRLTHFLHFDLNPFGGFTKGLGYRLEYSLGMIQLDLGLHYSRGGFGGYSPEQNHDDTNTNEFLDQEHNNFDIWSLSIAEFGYSVRGRLFPLTERQWTQYARASIGYGYLKDETTQLRFNGLVYGVEAGFERTLNSKFSIAPYIAWRFGLLTRIPLSSINFGIGIGFGS